MSTTVKIIIGSLTLLLAVSIGSAWLWWQRSGSEYVRDAQLQYAEGRKQGADLDEQGCFDKAITVHRSESGQTFGGALRNSLVFRGCLESSRPAPVFCEGVPPKEEIMASSQWGAKVCGQLGFKDPYCPQLTNGIAEYCTSSTRRAKVAPK